MMILLSKTFHKLNNKKKKSNQILVKFPTILLYKGFSKAA